MATVVVAMSGGVDSSVAAYLLQKAGHRVIGATMHIWKGDLAADRTGNSEAATGNLKKEELLCGSWKAVHDARQVAEHLGIAHYTLDFLEPFEDLVVKYFVEEYLHGQTPNPCIVCNRQMKFGQLLEQARALGAEFLATGHYARTETDPSAGRFLLRRGFDSRKDQSYFLYSLNQEQLKHVFFPLGQYHKEDIRQIAREMNLVVAEKAESQEICFVPDNDYREFLRQRAAERIEPGPFLDTQDRILGRHQGLPFYTIGQRKGLGLALGRPMYVVRIEPERNAVILGGEEDLFHRRVWTKNNNFIPFPELTSPMKVEAKVRYAARPAEAIIHPVSDQQVLVEFVLPQRAVTPGQAVVYYQDDLVVGGGTIVRSE